MKNKYYFLVNGLVYSILETNSLQEVLDYCHIIRENYMEKGDYFEVECLHPDGSIEHL